MFGWIIKALCFCLLFIGSNAYAQYEYNKICIEAAPDGWARCQLKPDEFSKWGYGTGYGVAEGEPGVGYVSENQAVQETLRYFGFYPSIPPGICQFSYSLGEYEVLTRDGFKNSKQPIWKSAPLRITHGYVNNGNCQGVSTGEINLFAQRSTICKSPHVPASMWAWDVESEMCMLQVDKYPPPCDTCPGPLLQGNPISVPTREKVELVVDMVNSGPMPLDFRRTYRSHRARDKSIWFNQYYSQPAFSEMGEGWLHNHDVRLAFTENFPLSQGALEQVRMQTGDGVFHYFERNAAAGQNYKSRHPLHALSILPGGGGWIFEDKEQDRIYKFNANGRIVEQKARNGWILTYAYDASGKLVSVANAFGRQLQFAYNGAGQLSQVTSSDSRSVKFFYTNLLLTAVQQADSSNRQYIYTSGNATIPALLAGIVDENGVRYSTYTYDVEGWAATTQKAGNVERYAVASTLEVTDPLNTARTFNFSKFGNQLTYLGASSPLATDKESVFATGSVNQNGLVDFSYDHLYNQTTYTWDTSRRLPLAVTEAASQPESRTTSTTWHPQWRLPLTVTEPGRTTSYTYDNSGNVLTQTITDTGSGGTARTTAWTYNAAGLVATETAPNGAVTSYTYDPLGNLTQSTNALGHIDTYTHDGAGRVLTHTSPNGLTVAYTYDARGRMLTSNRGGQVTTLTYRPSGQVLTATLPHGHSITYTYDAAQRLTGWSDNRGASGTYTLDAMGNRLREDIRNSQGQLVWRLARTINSLNRVESTTLGAQSATYGYDSNGDPLSATNALGQSTSQSLDPLRRVKSITNAENATASLTYNALDSVTAVTDPKSVTTAYTRDALGNPTTETSPDSGSQSAQYDALGLPSSITNALGQATTITRDLLGRPTSIVHTGGTTTLRYDLTPTSKGYLSEIEDTSGLTTYQRDLQGRVVTQTQKLINNDTRTITYSYSTTTGLLASTTYPGGQVLQNVYDSTGQITGLTWAGQPLVTGITWNPLGQPIAWGWNLPGATAAIPATRTYNTAGQVTATDFSSYSYDPAGRIQSLTQKLWRPASTNAQASTISQATSTWTVQYSPAGRITGFTKTVAANTPADSTSYTYDTNGNRTASTRERAGTSTSRTYTIGSGTNRQLAFEQTTSSASNTASTSLTYQYNAAGDLLSDGLRSYQYDSQERLEKVTTGQGVDAPSTQYAHNALGQRVFKTEPLFSGGGSGSSATTSGRNLNNLLADPDDQSEEQDKPGLVQTVYEFFTRLWSPGTSDAQKLGYAYVYGQDGTLLGEYGMGGSNSSGTSQYLYLPTANGPMPIAAIVNGTAYAIHSDHLNTPRKLTQADGQVAWQWAYSAFGDEQPTLGAKRFTSETTNPTTGTTTIPEVTFNLRYPGQYYDKESNLHYNYFRSYSAERGRYTQADPIGLEGGFNRFGYVGGNALGATDPYGLWMCRFVGIVWVCKNPTPPLMDPDYGPFNPDSPRIPLPDFRVPGFMGICFDLFKGIFSEGVNGTDGEKSPERKVNPSKQDSPVWNDLDRAKDGIRTSGRGGKQRYYDWDYTHGDIEVYDRNGRHLGSMEPTTGELYKPPVPGRTIEIP